MDVPRNIRIFTVVVGTLKKDLAVLQHFEELVHLDRVELPYLVNKQHTSVRLSDCTGLGLRNSCNAQRASALVDGVVDRSHQRVRYASIIKPGSSGVDLYELGVAPKR